MQNYHLLPALTGKTLIKKISVILFLVAGILCSCKQNNKPVDRQPKPGAKLANDSAVKIYLNVIGLKYPKDSLESAVKLYKTALAEDPESKLVFYNFLNCYNYMNNYNASIALCSAWLKKNPEDVDVQYQRSMIYELQGKSELAKSGFKAVVDEIGKKQIPKIDTSLTPVQIDELLVDASLLYIAEKDNSKSLSLVNQLKASFPDNTRIEGVYNTIIKNNRLERIKEHLNYKGSGVALR
ncbi:hypothetical protein SAMN04488511_109196 [Pedobacter suwonensis]|uniref:Uncharacterized protein n=1 Tax=Pedobacter suwonensis TaxID=332999 RepID=A0A1I0TGE3_9SPHI|nr:hypothetical protein [Pedobacter suwonensis]SFA50861.1 hypothetical protein SAMN04488511_109196 [Pedobacter suwonensis]